MSNDNKFEYRDSRRHDSLGLNTEYKVDQLAGQRIYYRRENDCIKPEPYSEIFVGKLPRDMLEDELVPVFEKIGKIHQIRLIMNFSEKNRGFGFVSYYKAEDAALAVNLLNGYEIRPNRYIGVYKSVDNRRLFVGGIPVTVSKQELLIELSRYIDGIVNVIMYTSYENKNQNRGFAFVEFESHRHAAMARRKLSPGSLELWGVYIMVDWADPVPEVDPAVMAQVTILYIRKLDVCLSNQELWDYLTRYINSNTILKTHKIKDFAFVHFDKRESAEWALEILKGKVIGNEEIEVMWARPRIYSKSYRLNTAPDHFCKSLPPRMRKKVIQKKNEATRVTVPDIFNLACSPVVNQSSLSNEGGLRDMMARQCFPFLF